MTDLTEPTSREGIFSQKWRQEPPQQLPEIEYLIQSIIWNPDAPSLQPIVKKGVVIPSRRVLQGQFLFAYEGEHAVLIKYSKEVQSFGVKVSEKEDDWKKDSLSGNEKRAYESFQKVFLGMVDSITFKQP